MMRTRCRKARAARGAVNILVLEDDVDLAKLLSDVLKGHGFRVIYAHDGKVGLALARHTKPHLVLLNELMPGMNGIEVLRELRADQGTAAIKVILNSAEAGYEASAREAGADDFLHKPMMISGLLEMVSRVLGL